MTRSLDMDALKSLITGVQLGSFTRAAAQLGRSQSAVSMQIKKLEDRAGQALLERKSSGLVPTAAGEKLLTFARKIVALNDEALIAIGVEEAVSSVKLGLPQDFFDVVLPRTVESFSARTRNVHVDVQAGRNYALEGEVFSGRLDAAIAFYPHGVPGPGERLATLATMWMGGEEAGSLLDFKRLPLVLFDHPCLFRTLALKALEREGLLWRVALTTPSLPGIWSAVQSRQGLTVRSLYRIPEGIRLLRPSAELPVTDPIEVRLLKSDKLSPAAEALCNALREVTRDELSQFDEASRTA